jgi:large subunit ribosomal protein L4
MAKLDVRSSDGKAAGSVELDADVFEVVVRPDLIQAEVRRQLAARRSGTHATRNRAGVSGGGAKPYRQKGTGRARQGTTRAPQFAGGGSVFGPVPRSHSLRLNKKTRQAALRSALSLRQREGAVSVVDVFALGEAKTRQLVGLIGGLGLGETSLLLVTHEPDRNLELAARNLPSVDVIRAEGLNVYDVLRHKQVLLTRPALEAVQARLGGGAAEASA